MISSAGVVIWDLGFLTCGNTGLLGREFRRASIRKVRTRLQGCVGNL